MKKNLRSEAAIKRVIKHYKNYNTIVVFSSKDEPLIRFRHLNNLEIIAELDLREFVKKRKPLTGIKRQVDKIVRGEHAKQKTKKAKKGRKQINKKQAKRQKAVDS